jgi:CIC family chloride channel protein
LLFYCLDVDLVSGCSFKSVLMPERHNTCMHFTTSPFMKWIKLLYKLFSERLKSRLNKPQFVLYVASLVGLVSGLVAVLLKKLVHYLQHWIEIIPAPPTYLVFPVLGLIICVFVTRKFFGGAIERGIAMVVRSITKRSAVIPLSHTYSHIITSTITVGLGGSVGLESPIVATGSAVGSNIARINLLGYRERSLMIACGAAAGIAGVFNAPIAGIIFAIEVLLIETVVSYFIPLIISAVIGTLCSKIILEESILFNFALKQRFNYWNVPYYLMLGVLCGFVALYYAKVFKRTEHRLHNWKVNPYSKAIVGGLVLLALCFLFPPLFGEGYVSVKLVANGAIKNITDRAFFFSQWENSWGILVFAISIVLLKPIAAAVTIGSGGNGGNFAPSLFVGAYLGFAFSRLFNSSSLVNIPDGNFSLVGMAGVLSGVMYCPLTAIFLIAEITNGYELFIPLMIVSSTSYFIVKHYERFSMEMKPLAASGELFSESKELEILNNMSVHELVQDDSSFISGDTSMPEVVKLFSEKDLTVVAILDHDNQYLGNIELNDIKKALLQKQGVHQLRAMELAKNPVDVVYETDAMPEVMAKFDKANCWSLPVIDEERHFKGFITKLRLFSKYRQVIANRADIYEN